MVDSVLNGTRIMDDDGYIPSRAATFGAAGEGISEDFLALWLSTLILNVHPKKQPRAVGFLVARYVRATAHRCIRAFAQNMEERKRARQLGEKAFNHYVSHLGVSAICIWRVRAVEARVARMRLRTAVSRWLRDQVTHPPSSATRPLPLPPPQNPARHTVRFRPPAKPGHHHTAVFGVAHSTTPCCAYCMQASFARVTLPDVVRVTLSHTPSYLSFSLSLVLRVLWRPSTLNLQPCALRP